MRSKESRQGSVLREALERILDGETLRPDDARSVFESIMEGEAPPSLLAAFLMALRMRGETVTEVAAFAEVMRRRAIRIRTDRPFVLDTCGTGGDGAGTFNISTVAAFVVAATGIAVAKHGNRSVSSRCGSADLIQGLGIRIDGPPELAERALREIGIGFLFAPSLHPTMGIASEVRRELGVRTVFNLLGPLTNPAMATRQLLGVYDPAWVEKIALVLRELGSERAMVVHGSGLDEIALHDVTVVAELKEGQVRTWEIRPEQCGLRRVPLSEIAGGDPGQNTAIARAVLEGQKGPKRDIVLLNAAAALVIGGRATDLKEGIRIAGETIDSGAAGMIVDRLRALAPLEERRV